jgi:hypothetical protein
MADQSFRNNLHQDTYMHDEHDFESFHAALKKKLASIPAGLSGDALMDAYHDTRALKLRYFKPIVAELREKITEKRKNLKTKPKE